MAAMHGSGVELLRAAAHQRMPWKNGGGETLEIAVSPPGATLDTLEWRISMALVAQDGPFSMFPGVDRTLCILDGAGMDLDFGAGGMRRVMQGSAPLRFAADQPVDARLLDGAITDLNVMTRRDRYTHRVRRVLLDAKPLRMTPTSALLLLCEQGSVLCSVDDLELQLEARDALLLPEPSPQALLCVAAAAVGASVYLIELDPMQGG